MTAVEFLVLGLAVWRTSVLITMDSGPASIFRRLRESIAPIGTVIKDGSLAELVTCPYCMSMWVGIAVTIAYYARPGDTLAVCLPLALSGVATLCQQLTFDRDPEPMPSSPPPQ